MEAQLSRHAEAPSSAGSPARNAWRMAAITIGISSIAICMPMHARGPAPKGIHAYRVHQVTVRPERRSAEDRRFRARAIRQVNGGFPRPIPRPTIPLECGSRRGSRPFECFGSCHGHPDTASLIHAESGRSTPAGGISAADGASPCSRSMISSRSVVCHNGASASWRRVQASVTAVVSRPAMRKSSTWLATSVSAEPVRGVLGVACSKQ